MANPTDEKGGDSDDDLSSANDFVQIYMIQIDVIAGHNLEKADAFGKSDPYCKVSALSTSYTTCTIKKTLNPKWNENVQMTFFNDPKAIKFEMFDWDGKLGGKDDAIGNCEFNLTNDIYNDSNKGFNGKIKLKNCKSGELEIKIIARKLLPLQLEKRLTDLQNTKNQNIETITLNNKQIMDLNNKNKTFENEINNIENNINTLNEQITIGENDQKEQKEIGIKLNEENEQICMDVNNVEKEYNELENNEKDIITELDNIKSNVNKKNKECEELRNNINELIEKIENKKNKNKVEVKENIETVSDDKNISNNNTQSVVYGDKFMKSDYEQPNYGLLKNQIEIEEVPGANDNKCCAKCVVL